jgi:mRNA-degrading endonuclease RelE of RelBE toxin-antitoxin system
MGKYTVKISKSAEKDLDRIKKSGRKTDMEKIDRFFQ